MRRRRRTRGPQPRGRASPRRWSLPWAWRSSSRRPAYRMWRRGRRWSRPPLRAGQSCCWRTPPPPWPTCRRTAVAAGRACRTGRRACLTRRARYMSLCEACPLLLPPGLPPACNHLCLTVLLPANSCAPSQLRVLVPRFLRWRRRNRWQTLSQLCLGLFSGILLGLVFWRLSPNLIGGERRAAACTATFPFDCGGRSGGGLSCAAAVATAEQSLTSPRTLLSPGGRQARSTAPRLCGWQSASRASSSPTLPSSVSWWRVGQRTRRRPLPALPPGGRAPTACAWSPPPQSGSPCGR